MLTQNNQLHQGNMNHRMRFHKKRTLSALAFVASLYPTTGSAGVFVADFNSVPAGALVSGNALVDTVAGKLLLTNGAAQNGTMVVGDLDAGARVSAFSATFKGLAAGTTSPATDGFSFNFGDSSTLGVGFPRALSTGVSVVVNDRWGGYYGGVTTLSIVANGTTLQFVSLAPDFADDGAWHDLSVSYAAGTGLTASWTGSSGTKSVSATDAELSAAGFGLSGGETFSLNGTSGGVAGTHVIDDLSISTTVTVIPEPALSAVFCGLAALGFIALQRTHSRD